MNDKKDKAAYYLSAIKGTAWSMTGKFFLQLQTWIILLQIAMSFIIIISNQKPYKI